MAAIGHAAGARWGRSTGRRSSDRRSSRSWCASARSFVLPGTIFFLAWYMGFILLTAYAEDFMSERVYEGLTVGYCLALTQFVMVLVLGLMYLRSAPRRSSTRSPRRRSSATPSTAAATRRPTATATATRRRRQPSRRLGAGGRAMIVFAAVNTTALVVFGVVLSITLGITYWASKRASSAVGFYAAGRGITGFQNGLAISGDYLSAASFLGIAGLIYLYGFDGFVYSIGFLVAFLTVMFLLAERMRNSGKYTIADVLAFRLRERPARVAAAIGTLNVAAFYLIAQMVGAGVLIQALVGIDFTPAVLITGTFMLVYVVFGGMVATTWVQIIKAVLLMIGIVVMSVFVLDRVELQPDRAVQPGRGGRQGRGLDVLARPGHVPQEQHRHGLARPRARARHGGPAAHPHALLHRAGREGRALVGRLRDVHHRLLLPADDGHRLRRARDPRPGGRRGRRHRRQPRRAEPRPGARRRRRHDRRRPVPGHHRRRRVRDDPRGRRRARAVGLERGGARHLVEHHPQGQGLREARRSWSRRSPRWRSARSRC